MNINFEENIKKIVSLHLKEIGDLRKAPSLIVYKGVPPVLLTEISKSIEALNKNAIKDGCLVLEEAIKSKDDIKKLLNTTTSTYICTYEEFLSIVHSLNTNLIEQNIVIITNNLFYRHYPNFTDRSFVDIEQKIYEGENIKNDPLFNEFYIDSKYIKDVNFIEYKDISAYDLKPIQYIDFFKANNTSLEPITELENKNLENFITVFSEDPSYNQFKTKLCVGIVPETLNILLPDTGTQQNTELYVVITLLDLFNSKYTVYKHSNLPEKVTPRKDFTNILKNYWNSDNFRDITFYENPDISLDKHTIKQNVLIEDIVRNVENAQENLSYSDIFITAPTGSGKSILFQIPALYIAQKYKLVTIIISPLIALMNDQVNSLKERGFTNAALISSELTLIEKERVLENVKNGEISILYLSPESFLSYNIDYFIGDRKLGLLVIDEAHLVTTWGRDFRIDYWYLGTHIRKIKKYNTLKYTFPILALTATAVYNGIDDIALQTIESLEMTLPKIYIGNVRRDDISFDINNKYKYKGNHEAAKIENTLDFVIKTVSRKEKAIVYFPWTTQVEQVEQLLPNNIKEKVGKYFSKVDKYEKSSVLEHFHSNNLNVVLATKAFGMGIDISDIKIVYHHAPSGGLSDYVQEIGRAARSKNMQGIAKIDYCEKDLKFFKILYGLSGIKQYQTKFTLEKIYELFLLKGKKQNFLVSSEDFGFVFSDRIRELDTKVKSALLLISKDLLKKSGFNVLIVRPKSVFSLVYGCVDSKDSDLFNKKYGKYSKKVSNKINVATTKSSRYEQNQNVIETDTGDIYEIQLDKLWEESYVNESFPMIKKKFFDMNLFSDIPGNVCPRYRLYIKLRDSPNATYSNLSDFFIILDKILVKLGSSFFTRDEFEKELGVNFKKETLVKRYSTLILDLFTVRYDPYQSVHNKDAFIQEKQNDFTKLTEYRVIENSYNRIYHGLLRDFNLAFNSNSEFENFFNSNHDYRLRLAYLIESLGCGSYEVTGGKFPQIFIRINDVYKIKSLIDSDNYSNEILKDIDERHKRSIDTMSKFFTTDMNSQRRWDFLEDYFLGKSIP